MKKATSSMTKAKLDLSFSLLRELELLLKYLHLELRSINLVDGKADWTGPDPSVLAYAISSLGGQVRTRIKTPGEATFGTPRVTYSSLSRTKSEAQGKTIESKQSDFKSWVND